MTLKVIRRRNGTAANFGLEFRSCSGPTTKPVRCSLVPRPSSLVGKNKGEEGLVKLIT